MQRLKAVVDGSVSLMSGFVPPRPSPSNDPWSAPAAPSASPSPLPTGADPTGSGPIADPVDDPVRVLDLLTEQVDGVAGAILASVDGFGIARSTSMADEPSHPAMLAAAVGLAHQLVSIGAGETLRQLVVDHDAGLMLVWPVGTQRVLAVLASSRVDQRALRAVVRRYAPALAGVGE